MMYVPFVAGSTARPWWWVSPCSLNSWISASDKGEPLHVTPCDPRTGWRRTQTRATPTASEPGYLCVRVRACVWINKPGGKGESGECDWQCVYVCVKVRVMVMVMVRVTDVVRWLGVGCADESPWRHRGLTSDWTFWRGWGQAWPACWRGCSNEGMSVCEWEQCEQ